MLALSLVACSGPKEIDLAAVKTDIEGGNLFIDSFVKLSDEKINSVALLDTTLCESAEFYIGSGATGEEYGLFKCKDDSSAQQLVQMLEARRDAQKELYAGYAVDAVPRIENTVIRRSGVYVVYVSADKYNEAATIVGNHFD